MAFLSYCLLLLRKIYRTDHLLFCLWDLTFIYWQKYFCDWNYKMPRSDATVPRKNIHDLKLPEIPRDTAEQNHSENGYENNLKIFLFIYLLNLVSRMSVLNVYKKNLNNLIVPINKKIGWKNFLIQNVRLEN